MIQFNKNTIYECYDRMQTNGINSTLNYYRNELKNVPDNVFLHIKSGYINLVKLLENIDNNCQDDDNLFEKVVGEGPIDNGEYWGIYVAYFPKGEYYKSMFNKLIEETPFGIQGKIK